MEDKNTVGCCDGSFADATVRSITVHPVFFRDLQENACWPSREQCTRD
jgi:hypothetical protein